MADTKKCSGACGLEKPLSEFGPNGIRNGKPRLRSRCRVCENGQAQPSPRASEPAALILEHRKDQELRRLRKERKELLKELDLADRRAGIVEEFTGAVKRKPKRRRRSKSGKPVASALVLFSDWHVEEPIDADKVAGINEFNLEIAQQRISNLYERLLDKLEMYGHGYQLDELVMWLGGDLFSGYIHDELIETNELSPTECLVWLQQEITSFIDTLLVETQLDIRVPCSFGNHGRTTPKRRISTGAENNFEWLLYQQLAAWYKDNDRVSFITSKAKLTYVDIQGYQFLFTHGEELKGTDPFSDNIKTIRNWKKMRAFDYICCGHWHNYLVTKGGMRNGSLPGVGPYGVEIGAEPGPAEQGFCLVVEGEGMSCCSPIRVE